MQLTRNLIITISADEKYLLRKGWTVDDHDLWSDPNHFCKSSLNKALEYQRDKDNRERYEEECDLKENGWIKINDESWIIDGLTGFCIHDVAVKVQKRRDDTGKKPASKLRFLKPLANLVIFIGLLLVFAEFVNRLHV